MDKYFIYDPENRSFETFATLAEQSKAAEETIRSYLEGNPDDRWPEEVVDIVSGIITERATQCELVDRPDEIDDEGYDEDEVFWPEGMTHRCNYEMDSI